MFNLLNTLEKPMSSKQVYLIYKTNTKEYNMGRNSWTKDVAKAKYFKTEKSATTAISSMLRAAAGRSWYSSSARVSVGVLATNYIGNIEIQQHTITSTLNTSSSADQKIRDVLIAQQLADEYDYYVSWFWEKMAALGYSEQVKFIVKFEEKKSLTYMQNKTEARDALRQLGIKTRSFKEFNGYFGLLDRDQGLKARLTLPTATFIDVDAIKSKIF